MWFGFRKITDKLMMLFNNTTIYVPFPCFDFFSQISNMLIINIPHNLKTTE